MAYQANRRSGIKNLEEQRNIDNNAKNIRNAADVAIASKNPYAMAAGGAVKAADKVTGGKASQSLGKAMNKVTKASPMGRRIQKASNNISESGLGDKAGQIAALKNRAPRGQNPQNQVKNNNTSDSTNENLGGGQKQGSLPSSDSNKNAPSRTPRRSGFPRLGLGRDSINDQDPSNDNDDKRDKSASGIMSMTKNMRVVVTIILPASLFLIITLLFMSVGVFSQSEYEDGLGVGKSTGRDIYDEEFDTATPEQQAFYDRINDVEMELLSQGKNIDAIQIAAVFNILNQNGAELDYDDMDEGKIREIANAMLNGGVYDETTFKSNLINNIFPKYLPRSSNDLREQMAEDVLEYVEEYNDLIEKEEGDFEFNNCISTGTCSYDVKGFYIKGKGNVSKRLKISDLYVRLMQCGSADGHNYGGTFGKALEGESLVPFEKYILGVAYQEIGPNAPAEAIKAQMVAARSYILARHVDMGGWRTLKQESNGRWVLQAASCTQDQVYCDPDKGCSSKDGQWSQVYSGAGHGKTLKGPLATSSPLRTYANQTSGEVLTNKNGYIVYSGYTQTEQNKMISLAKNGLNYKQILLQVYNQGSRNYGATNVSKTSCKSGTTLDCGTSSGGVYVNWKQAGAPWSSVKMGNSGQNIGQIGCLVTSVAMLIQKSGVPTVIPNFNPGTFVQFLNQNGGFDSSGNLQYAPISKAAPRFRYVNQVSVKGMSKEQKLNAIRNYVSQGYYITAEVSNGGQHWVAIDSVSGNTIKIMDPGSNVSSLWNSKYPWQATKTLNLFKVS